MDTIGCYDCFCGEEIYEDDEACVNCGNIADPSKFNQVPTIKIISQGEIEVEEISLIKEKK